MATERRTSRGDSAPALMKNSATAVVTSVASASPKPIPSRSRTRKASGQLGVGARNAGHRSTARSSQPTVLRRPGSPACAVRDFVREPRENRVRGVTAHRLPGRASRPGIQDAPVLDLGDGGAGTRTVSIASTKSSANACNVASESGPSDPYIGNRRSAVAAPSLRRPAGWRPRRPRGRRPRRGAPGAGHAQRDAPKPRSWPRSLWFIQRLPSGRGPTWPTGTRDYGVFGEHVLPHL